MDERTPGSRDAHMFGCTCPAHENCYGAGRHGSWLIFGWAVRGDCMLHAGLLREIAVAPDAGDEVPHG